MLWSASWSERLDDDHASTAAGAWEREDVRPICGVGAAGVGRGCGNGEQLADAGDVFLGQVRRVHFHLFHQVCPLRCDYRLRAGQCFNFLFQSTEFRINLHLAIKLFFLF